MNTLPSTAVKAGRSTANPPSFKPEEPKRDWCWDYVNFIEFLLQDKYLFPYPYLIYDLVAHHAPQDLQMAWQEAYTVFTRQEIKAHTQLGAQCELLPEEEQRYLGLLGFDRFTMPSHPSLIQTSRVIKPMSDYAILALCHDQKICSNNRHATATYADRILQIYESFAPDYALGLPIINFYNALITIHKESWNYAAPKQRALDSGLEDDDLELMITEINRQLEGYTLESYLQELLSLFANEEAYHKHIEKYMWLIQKITNPIFQKSIIQAIHSGRHVEDARSQTQIVMAQKLLDELKKTKVGTH